MSASKPSTIITGRVFPATLMSTVMGANGFSLILASIITKRFPGVGTMRSLMYTRLCKALMKSLGDPSPVIAILPKSMILAKNLGGRGPSTFTCSLQPITQPRTCENKITLIQLKARFTDTVNCKRYTKKTKQNKKGPCGQFGLHKNFCKSFLSFKTLYFLYKLCRWKTILNKNKHPIHS